MNVIRSGDRALWPGNDIRSRQSFPATGSTRMTDYAFGLLLIHNDDLVEPGEGFDMHQHSDIEIVTWIVDGTLRHRDSSGTEMILSAGQVEAITAGSGISHAEVNAVGSTGRDVLRVIQMWLPTDAEGLRPSHSTADLNEALDAGGLVTVVDGDGADGAAHLSIHTAGARLRAARLAAGESVVTAPSAYQHIFVVKGEVDIDSESGGDVLQEGDAARLNDDGAVRISGHGGGEGAEVLVWEMDRSVRTEPRWGQWRNRG